MKRVQIREIDRQMVNLIIPPGHILDPKRGEGLQYKSDSGKGIALVSCYILRVPFISPYYWHIVGKGLRPGDHSDNLLWVNYDKGETLLDVIRREYRRAYREAKRIGSDKFWKNG